MAYHVSLMSPDGVHRVYPSELFVAANRSKCNVSNTT